MKESLDGGMVKLYGGRNMLSSGLVAMVNWYGVCMGVGHVHGCVAGGLADDGVSVRPEYD